MRILSAPQRAIATMTSRTSSEYKTLPETIIELHEELNRELQAAYYPCFMDGSDIGSFFKLFLQRKWAGGRCECFRKLVPMPADSEGHHPHYFKCRHLHRWERAHSEVLQRVYPKIRALSALSDSGSGKGITSYEKFLMYAFTHSAECVCDELNPYYSSETPQQK